MLRAGYYWPTLMKDSISFFKKCDKWYRLANLHHTPTELFQMMTLPLPFYQWGLDIWGMFPWNQSNWNSWYCELITSPNGYKQKLSLKSQLGEFVVHIGRKLCACLDSPKISSLIMELSSLVLRLLTFVYIWECIWSLYLLYTRRPMGEHNQQTK